MVTGSVTLTRDELYVFLALLGLRPVNALPQDMAAGITDDEAAIRFNCGELTLHERGLLTYAAEQRPVLHDFLIALVGTAALPEATLLLQRSQPDGTSTARYFQPAARIARRAQLSTRRYFQLCTFRRRRRVRQPRAGNY